MSSVTISDMGWKKWRNGIRDLADLAIEVGVLGDAGRTAHRSLPPGSPGDGEASDSDATLADIAYWNEFGTDDGHIPERPAHRVTFEELKKPLSRRLAAAVRLVGEGAVAPKVQLDKIGLWYVGELRQEIIAFSEPGNAEATIEKKGEDNPLIDTGRYVNAIQHLVKDADED